MSNKRKSKIKNQKSKSKDQENYNTKFYFFSLASTGDGISGGDRIYIELARRWSKKVPVNIITTIEGVNMMDRQKLKRKKLNVVSVANNLPDRFIFKYIYKTLVALKIGMTLDFKEEKVDSFLYSSSEFWMDVFPAVLLKIKYPKVKWIASWYQTAPNPLKGFTERKRKDKHFITALLYWLVQLPIKPLIKLYADKVIVNNEDERKQFPKMEKRGDVLVLIGAVPLADIKKFQNKMQKSNSSKKYDAVFQGRFHAQKGVVELIDIWKDVVDKIPDAKLAMIGDGPLMQEVKNKISKLKIQDNVELFGYVFDGPEKYEIFANSKLVLHPAYYDSGGMAAAEVMAFGIPAVAFDLKAYESYYPKGMVKVKDEDEFAKKIIELLEKNITRNRLGYKAQNLIETDYSWERRSEEVYNKIHTT